MSENSKVDFIQPLNSRIGQPRPRRILDGAIVHELLNDNCEWERRMKHLNPLWRPSRNTVGEHD